MRCISKWLRLYIFQQAPSGPSESLAWQEGFPVLFVPVLSVAPGSQVELSATREWSGKILWAGEEPAGQRDSAFLLPFWIATVS